MNSENAMVVLAMEGKVVICEGNNLCVLSAEWGRHRAVVKLPFLSLMHLV
jgi:hypothetical protein